MVVHDLDDVGVSHDEKFDARTEEEAYDEKEHLESAREARKIWMCIFRRITHIICTYIYIYICIYTYIHTLHYITLHYITLHYITLKYITGQYRTVCYITLHYITFHYITLFVCM